jgi:hypothetical protein
MCIVSETDTADIELVFPAPLHLVAPTAAQQRALLQMIATRANAVMGLAGSTRNYGLRSTATVSQFRVYYTVLPRTIADPTLACTAAQALNSAQSSQLAVTYGTTLLTPSSKRSVCPGQLPTFTTTTSTVTETTVTNTTITTTGTTTTFYNASAVTTSTVDPALATGPSSKKSDDEWDDEYTLFLVGALLVVFVVLMSVGLVCAVRENSKRKMLELGLLVNPAHSPFSGNGQQPQYAMKAEAGPGEEQKWLNDGDASHFYPPPGMNP